MNLESILQRAREITDNLERTRYLDEACSGDAELKRLIESRLRTPQVDTAANTVLMKSRRDDGATGSSELLDENVTFISDTLAEARQRALRNVPTAIAGYELFGEIARGGMGVVLRGRETLLDRDVAIKVLLHDRDSENAIRRFTRESRVVARLTHPGIPPVYALGQLPDGSPFLAMKLIRGQTLSALLKERPSTDTELPRFLQTFEQVAQAVGFAHSRGIVHRDLKPANVMVGEFGEVQVMDWGIAKILPGKSAAVSSGDELTGDDIAPAWSTPELPIGRRTGGDDRTRAGTIMGSPTFMAPEQARGEPVDARADVYSLGAILSVILTGKAPFEDSESAEDIIRLAAAGQNQRILAQLDACPADAELIALAKRCLSPNAADRPADAREVADRIAAHRADVELRLRLAEKHRTATEVLLVEQQKRRRLLIAASGLIVLVLSAGIGVSFQQLLKTRVAKRDAEAERDKAARRYVVAMDAFNDMVFPIQERLSARNVSLEVRKELLNTARTGLQRLLTDADQATAIDPTLVWSFIQMGRIEVALGHFDAARREFEVARDMARQLITSRPNDAEAIRALSESLDGLGQDAMARKDAPLALKYFEERLRIMRDQMTRNPDDRDVQRQLGHCLRRMSEVSLLLGNRDDALEFAQQRLQITLDHAAADPDDMAIQNQLANSHELIGTAAGYLNQTELARSSMEEALKITERLVIRQPDNYPLQRSLSVYLNRLGNFHEAGGQTEAAAERYAQALVVAQQIAEGDPDSVQAQLDVFVGCDNLAACEVIMHDYEAAIDWLNKGRAIVVPLKERNLLIGQFENAVANVDQQLADCERNLRAIRDLDFVLSQPAESIPEFLNLRLKALSRTSDSAGLVATASAFTDIAAQDAKHCYPAALAWAAACSAATDLSAKETCAAQVISLLTCTPIGDAEQITSRSALAELIQSEPRFSALRDIPAFQEFQRSLTTPP